MPFSFCAIYYTLSLKAGTFAAGIATLSLAAGLLAIHAARSHMLLTSFVIDDKIVHIHYKQA